MNNTLSINNLAGLNIKALREIAKNLQLKGVSRLLKEELITAITIKYNAEVKTVEEVKLVNDIADDLANANVWSRETGTYDNTIVTRWLNKLNATTPVSFTRDSRLSDTDKLPVETKNGKKATLTVAKIKELANKIEEVKPMENKSTIITVNNDREREILEKLNAKNRARAEEKKAKQEVTKSLAQAEREAIQVLCENIHETKELDKEENKLFQLTEYANFLFSEVIDVLRIQEKELGVSYADYYKAKEEKASKEHLKSLFETIEKVKASHLSITTLMNRRVEIIADLIDKSFSKDELVSKDNFEKRTEFDALIDAVLIRSDMFDYKVKDNELMNSSEIATFLLAEARHLYVAKQVNYHNRMIANENCFVQNEDGKALLYPVTKGQLNKINQIRMTYYRSARQFPQLFVDAMHKISSSTLAGAIIIKYYEYLEMDAPATDHHLNQIFDKCVKFGLACEEQRVKFVTNGKLNYSKSEADSVNYFLRDNMSFAIAHKKAMESEIAEQNKKVSLISASLELLSFTDLTRVRLRREYQNELDNYRLSLYNVEDDK